MKLTTNDGKEVELPEYIINAWMNLAIQQFRISCCENLEEGMDLLEHSETQVYCYGSGFQKGMKKFLLWSCYEQF